MRMPSLELMRTNWRIRSTTALMEARELMAAGVYAITTPAHTSKQSCLVTCSTNDLRKREMNSTSIFVALTAVACLFLQAPVNVRAKETAMPAVDDAGRIELGLLPNRPQREATVRSFIWSHWIGKRRGKITVVDLTKEEIKLLLNMVS